MARVGHHGVYDWELTVLKTWSTTSALEGILTRFHVTSLVSVGLHAILNVRLIFSNAPVFSWALISFPFASILMKPLFRLAGVGTSFTRRVSYVFAGAHHCHEKAFRCTMIALLTNIVFPQTIIPLPMTCSVP